MPRQALLLLLFQLPLARAWTLAHPRRPAFVAARPRIAATSARASALPAPPRAPSPPRARTPRVVAVFQPLRLCYPRRHPRVASRASPPLSSRLDVRVRVRRTPRPAATKKVLVPVADGTEEIEAVTVIDVLRRAGAEVVVMSVEDDRNEVVCSRGVRLVADKNVKELAGRGAPADWDLIAVPGGMPGAEHIADHVKFHAVLEKHFRAGKLMAAICAAPAICFEPKGFLEGYAATAHPAFVDELGGSLLEKNIYQDCRVVVDTQIVTSRGPGTSMEWALCLVEQLYGSRKAREVAGPMVVQPANARIRQNLEWRLDETPLE